LFKGTIGEFHEVAVDIVLKGIIGAVDEVKEEKKKFFTF